VQPLPADTNGFIHAYKLTGGGSGVAVPEKDLAESWENCSNPVWIHVDYSQPKVQEWVQTHSGLDDVVVEALLAEETRPRVIGIGDGLLICLRGVNLNPGAEPEDMVAVRLWIDRQKILSSTKRKIMSIDDLAASIEQGKGPEDTGNFLVELSDLLIQRMGETVDDLELQMDEQEDLLIEGKTEGLRYEVSELRRETVSLKKHMAPQREALTRLATEKIDWLTEDNRRYIREVNEHLIRHIENLEAVRERAALTQEELLSRVSEELNTRMYVLAVVASIFMPLSFLTGLFGINVGGIPGAHQPYAFAAFMAILGVIFIFQIIFFRKKNWL
jgi:zinc transporter